MSIELQIEERPNYILAKFTGSGEIDEVWRNFDSIAEECDRVKKNKVLIDYTGARVPLSLTDRFFLGEKYLIIARHGVKIAKVASSEQIDSKKFAELVAQNRGVKIRVFLDVQAAEEWLLSN